MIKKEKWLLAGTMRFDLITHSHTPPHMHTHLLTHTLKYTKRDFVPNKKRTIQKLLSILLSRKRKKVFLCRNPFQQKLKFSQ